MKTRFYVVRQLDFKRFPPVIPHERVEGAMAEARRLAPNAPNDTFHVVQVIGGVRHNHLCDNTECKRILSVLEPHFCGWCGHPRIKSPVWQQATNEG